MDPSTIETGQLIAELGIAAGIYLKIRSAVREMAGKGETREITNNPLNVQAASRPATMEDVAAVAERVTRVERQLVETAKHSQDASHENGEKIDDLRDRMDDKLTSLTDDIREITRAVGRLEGS